MEDFDLELYNLLKDDELVDYYSFIADLNKIPHRARKHPITFVNKYYGCVPTKEYFIRKSYLKEREDPLESDYGYKKYLLPECDEVVVYIGDIYSHELWTAYNNDLEVLKGCTSDDEFEIVQSIIDAVCVDNIDDTYLQGSTKTHGSDLVDDERYDTVATKE